MRRQSQVAEQRKSLVRKASQTRPAAIFLSVPSASNSLQKEDDVRSEIRNSAMAKSQDGVRLPAKTMPAYGSRFVPGTPPQHRWPTSIVISWCPFELVPKSQQCGPGWVEGPGASPAR